MQIFDCDIVLLQNGGDDAGSPFNTSGVCILLVGARRFGRVVQAQRFG